MKQKSFFVVNNHSINKPEWNMGLDLKGKRSFGYLVAVDYKEFYGLPEKRNRDDIYDRYENDYLSIFKYIELSDKEIEEASYLSEHSILPLLDESQFDERTPTDFERQYLSPRKLRKVRIMYNKEFLPIIVEGYYEGVDAPDWQLLRTISYPFKSKRAFDSELADYIDLVKDIQQEQETERKIENG